VECTSRRGNRGFCVAGRCGIPPNPELAASAQLRSISFCGATADAERSNKALAVYRLCSPLDSLSPIDYSIRQAQRQTLALAACTSHSELHISSNACISIPRERASRLPTAPHAHAVTPSLTSAYQRPVAVTVIWLI
jgi:hypothetical protein